MNTVYIPQAARVIENLPLNESTRMLRFDRSIGSVPGQFANLWVPGLDEKPFSVAHDDGETTSFAVSAVGPFSRHLVSIKSGGTVGIRGPYGNGFSISEDKRVVLVGGGFGTAPLHFLGEQLLKNGCEVIIIIGARSKNLLMYLDKCEEIGFRVLHTTNDGSSGEAGFVTGPLERLLQDETIDLVQTCGPEKMMEAVAKMCQANKVECEVSIERYMKCGFGICGQCACDDKLVCRDGTVFSGEEALSLADFGVSHRGPEGKRILW